MTHNIIHGAGLARFKVTTDALQNGTQAAINYGDTVAISQTFNDSRGLFCPGRVYVIQTISGGTLLRHCLEVDKQAGKLKLVAYNEAYGEITLDLNQIKAAYAVWDIVSRAIVAEEAERQLMA